MGMSSTKTNFYQDFLEFATIVPYTIKMLSKLDWYFCDSFYFCNFVCRF